MTALVNTDTGEIIEPMPSAEARQLTTEAQTEFGATADHYERGWAAIEKVLRRNGFLALGYRSQGDYLGTEFAHYLDRLNVPQRRLAARELTDAGLSTRAIAPIVGVSHKTVVKDLQVVPEVPPADAPAPARPPIVGVDGKTYQRPTPRVAAPRAAPRRPLPDQFFDAAYDAIKKVEALHRLISDDRFPQNAEKVAAKHRNDLLRARDLFEQVIHSLPETEPTP